MHGKVQEFDRLFLFPLRAPFLGVLVAVALLALLVSWLERPLPLLIYTSLGLVWLLFCGRVVRTGGRAAAGLLLRDPRGILALRESGLLLAASSASLIPLIAFLVIGAGTLTSADGLTNIWATIALVLGGYGAFGLCLAIWLPAVALVIRDGDLSGSVLRVDRHLQFWLRAGREGVKYWVGSLFFLMLTGSIGELEIFTWWPFMRVIEPFLLSFGLGYWSLLSIRLASALANRFGEVLDSLHGISLRKSR